MVHFACWWVCTEWLLTSVGLNFIKMFILYAVSSTCILVSLKFSTLLWIHNEIVTVSVTFLKHFICAFAFCVPDTKKVEMFELWYYHRFPLEGNCTVD